MVASGDFNGDGRSDVAWWNSETGALYLYFMNGLAAPTYATLERIGSNQWKVVGAADFNGDGYADLLWRNDATGVVKSPAPVHRVRRTTSNE